MHVVLSQFSANYGQGLVWPKLASGAVQERPGTDKELAWPKV